MSWLRRHVTGVTDQALPPSGDIPIVTATMTGAKLISTTVRDDRWKAVFIHGAEDGQLSDLEGKAIPLRRTICGGSPSARRRRNISRTR
jgi:hypothetical protein